MSLFPSCAYAFRNNLVTEDAQPLEISYASNFLRSNPKIDANNRWEHFLPYDKRVGLVKKIQTKTFAATATTNFAVLPTVTGNILTTATTETTLNADKGLLQTATPQYISVSGFLADNPDTKVGDLRLLNANEFGSITWLSLDNQSLKSPKRSLLTVSTKQQNTNMFWTGTTSVNNNWGNAPTLQAPTTVNLRLNMTTDSIFLIALDPTGKLKSQIKILPTTPQYFDVLINQSQDKTLWYAIQTARAGTTNLNDPSVKTGFFDVFPNPIERGHLQCRLLFKNSTFLI